MKLKLIHFVDNPSFYNIKLNQLELIDIFKNQIDILKGIINVPSDFYVENDVGYKIPLYVTTCYVFVPSKEVEYRTALKVYKDSSSTERLYGIIKVPEYVIDLLGKKDYEAIEAMFSLTNNKEVIVVLKNN